MDETKVEIAIEIMQKKIIEYIKNYKGKDKEEFERELKKLTEEKEKVYDLDEETIKKVYDTYLNEIRGEKVNGKI